MEGRRGQKTAEPPITEASMNILSTFKVRLLDRYIIKKFIGTFFMALLLIIVIVIIFDISEKIDDFVDKEGNSEIIAMLSGGVSFGRLMYPYFISALLIALMSLSLNLFVIPSANEKRLAFEEQYIKGQKFYNTNRNIHYQIAPGEFVYVESFSTWNNTAYKFTLESTKDSHLLSKLSAESAAWDSTTGGWRLKNYTIRDYSTSQPGGAY